MTPDEIRLVKSSWQKVLPVRDTAAEVFYTKLFTLDPSLKPLFAKTDMKKQGHNLTAMISVAASGLSEPETIVPAVQDLGRRHSKYGVKGEHYDTVGAALIWTLQHTLGEAFTADVKRAWVAAYTLLSSTMKEAAADVPA